MNLARNYHNIALIGFMGTGKTSVAHLLAHLLAFRVVDTDDLIERRAGKRISAIFADDGEAAFRAIESEVLAGLQTLRRCVIATGGGVGANPAHVASLKEHSLVVCLWASPDCIWKRVRHQTHRPLLNTPEPEQAIRALLASRESCYRQADILVGTEHRTVRAVAQHIAYEFRGLSTAA